MVEVLKVDYGWILLDEEGLEGGVGVECGGYDLFVGGEVGDDFDLVGIVLFGDDCVVYCFWIVIEYECGGVVGIELVVSWCYYCGLVCVKYELYVECLVVVEFDWCFVVEFEFDLELFFGYLW